MAMRLRAPEVEREFDRLYRRHRREVYSAVLRDVRNPDEAEDVTQTAFLDAYRALQRGDEPLRPRAWLLTIAQNAARRRYRDRAAGPREVELEADLLVAPDEAGPSAVEIRQAIARLGPRQRQALVLREIAGRSYAEIAAALDLSVPAVETLLFRARRALRVELTGWEPPARPPRRRLGGLLLWPPTSPGEAAGSLAGWAAGKGAAVKVAGALSVAALGAGVATQSGRTEPPDPPERRPALHVPAPAVPAAGRVTVTPANERAPVARPRAKAAGAEKKPSPPRAKAAEQQPAPSPVDPPVDVPEVAAGPITLPEVAVPTPGELVPAPLPAPSEVGAPALPDAGLDDLP